MARSADGEVDRRPTGSGPPTQLPRLLRQAKPYAERLFHYRELDRLKEPAARSALVTPARGRACSSRGRRAVPDKATRVTPSSVHKGASERRSSCATLSPMSDEVSVRELRNHTAEVLRRVEAGERLRVTVDRRPVAELVPLPSRATWVPRERVLDALVQADAGLRSELAEALPDTVDEL